jgi:hypothetical protein
MEVRRWQLVPEALGLGLALVACGETTTTPGAVGPGEAGSDAGLSGRPAGGEASAGTGGGSSRGGNAAGGAQGGGGASGAPQGGGGASSLSPAISAAWAWNECGRIPASSYPDLPPYSKTVWSLSMSGDGQLLVTNAGLATAWRVAEPFAASERLWVTGGESAFNTDVSRDGRWVATSGDSRSVLDARSGTALVLSPTEEVISPNPLCLGTEFRFSPDGRYVAGKRYGTQIDVFDLTTLRRVVQIETGGCGQGLAFGAEHITSPEGSFRTSDWTPTAELTPTPSTTGLVSPCVIHLEPSSAIPTTCCQAACRTEVGDITISGGRHASLSSEGHWLVAGGTLAHLPSGETRVLDEQANEALFAPNGDVIVGEHSGDLVRFCRSE